MKKHKHTLHYVITNCGDGSASLSFMESEALAEYDQSDDNGWGEPCYGTIDLESDSPISVNEDVKTKENYLLELFENDDSRLDEFIEQFFPNGLPEFSVKIDESWKDKRYANNLIYVNGVKVGEVMELKEHSGEALLERLKLLSE